MTRVENCFNPENTLGEQRCCRSAIYCATMLNRAMNRAPTQQKCSNGLYGFNAHPDKARRNVRAFSLVNLAVCAALLAALPQPSFAAPSCTFTSVTGVSFGAYDVFTTLPNNNGVGSFTILCQNGGVQNFVVTLSTGQSNGYASRVMKSGGNPLNYNLYTSAARTIVWGDGTGGSSVMTASRNSTTTLSIFGQIPAGQDAAIGVYTDSITAIVNF